MTSSSLKRIIAFLLLICCVFGVLPTPLTEELSRMRSARADGEPADTSPVSDTLSCDGWLYRLCADGYAELMGYSDAAATALTLPSSLDGRWVTRIGENAFAGNAALRTITAPASISEWKETAFPNSAGMTVKAYNGSAALSFAQRRDFQTDNLSAYDFFSDILDLSELRPSQWSYDGSKLMIQAPWSLLVRPGSRLYLPMNDRFTKGVPVMVDSVASDGAVVIASAREVSFMDAVQTYRADDVQLVPDIDNIIILSDGFSVRTPASSQTNGPVLQGLEVSATLPITFPVSFDLGDYYRLSGEISYTPTITASVDFGWFQINELAYSNKSTFSKSLKLSAQSHTLFGDDESNGAKQSEPINLRFARIPLVSAGLISAVVDLSLIVSADGAVTLKQTTETFEEFKWNLKTNTLTTNKSKSTKEFSLSAAVKITAEAEVAIVGNLGFATFSVDFLKLYATVGVEASLTTTSDAVGCFDIKVDGIFKVGIKIGILSSDDVNATIAFGGDIINVKWPIWSAHYELSGTGPELGLFTKACSRGDKVKAEFRNDLDGIIEIQTVKRGEPLTRPSDPTREGYTFAGWYYIDMLNDIMWDFDKDTVQNAMVLYPKWVDAAGATPTPTPTGAGGSTATPAPSVTPSPTAVDFTYKSKASGVTITGYTGSSLSIVIPAEIDGKPVVAIEQNAFKNSKVRSVVLPASVSSIGKNAFYRSSLRFFDASDTSVELIEEYTFYNCERLERVLLPPTLKEIGIDAFWRCSQNSYSPAYGITSIDLSNTCLERIGFGAFEDCLRLREIALPATLKRIEEYAFEDSWSLRHIVLPGDIEFIADNAFKGNTDLSITYLPSSSHSVTYDTRGGSYIGARYAIANMSLVPPAPPKKDGFVFTGWFKDKACTSAWRFDTDIMPAHNLVLYARWESAPSTFVYGVSGGSATIRAYAGSSPNVVVPERLSGATVTAIAGGSIPAGTTTISIPASVMDIAADAFAYASGLTAVEVAPENPVYHSVDGVLFQGDVLVHYPRAKSGQSYTVPDGTAALASCAFYGCDTIRTLSIPASVRRLHDSAIAHCGNLYSVTFATDVATVGQGCLYSCADTLRAYGPVGAPSLTAYANDCAIPYNLYDVVYMQQGKVIGYATARAGDKLANLLNAPDGEKTFQGWSSSQYYTRIWDVDKDVMPAGQLTLYAVWDYDFDYQLVDGKAVLTKYTGTKSTVIVPETIGAYPVGSIADDCFPSNPALLKGNRGGIVDTFAQAHALPFEPLTFTLTFIANGGSIPEARTLCATDAIDLPTTKRTGYRFTGWYTDAELHTVCDDGGQMPAADLTLYAGWEQTDELVADVPFTFANVSGGVAITGYTGAFGDVVIPSDINGDAVVAIAERAFENNRSLNAVTLPSSVTSIGRSAFSGSSVDTVVIADGLTDIGAYAFSGCSLLHQITLPSSVAAIGEYAFEDCTALQSIAVPQSVTHIEQGTFSGCKRLVSASLPDGLLIVRQYAFAYCERLSSVSFGSKLESVSNDSFLGCRTLEAFAVASNNLYYDAIDGVLFSRGNWSLMLYPEGKKSSSYTIPEGTVTLMDGAMRNSAIQCLRLNGDIQTIDTNALAGSILLSEIRFADNGKLTDIGANAFGGCANLTKVSLPDSVTGLGVGAFHMCPLTEVTISPNTVLAEGAIDARSGLTIYGTRGSNAEAYAVGHGIRFIDPGSDIVATSLSMPDTLALNVGAAQKLTASIEPANATETLLRWSSSDATVAIVDENGMVEAHSEGVATITAAALSGASAQCEVTVSEPVIAVTDLKLSTVSIKAVVGSMIPVSPVVIPANATDPSVGWTVDDSSIAVYHGGCIIACAPGSATLTMTAGDGLSASCAITIVDGTPPVLGDTEFALPSGLKEIKDGAFAGLPITVIRLPDGLERVGQRSFGACSTLRQVYIPQTVVYIAKDAFDGADPNLEIFGVTGSMAEAFASSAGYLFVATND